MDGAGRTEEVIQKLISLEDKCICVKGNREKYVENAGRNFCNDGY